MSASIAILLPRLSLYGGVETFAHRLSGALARAGYRVDFICARCETEPPAGVHPVVVGRHGLTRAGKAAWFAFAAERARRRGHYDLALGVGTTLRQDLLRVSGGPQRVFWELTERAWTPGPARAWKRLRRRLDPFSWVTGWIEARNVRAARTVVAVSDLNARWTASAHGLEASDIRVVYNRPDLDRFAPPDAAARLAARSALGIPDHQTALAFAGTSFPRKGLAPLISALPLLPEECVLHVAGGRNPARFQKLARETGVAERVRFLGRVDDMAGLYHACDCFVLPSLYDTCSNAVLEALACGCRVVGSADDGASFFLPEARRIQDPTDSGEIARRVREALAEPMPGAFIWPDGVAHGLDPLLEMVAELLAQHDPANKGE